MITRKGEKMWKKEGLDLIDTIRSPTPTAFCKNI